MLHLLSQTLSSKYPTSHLNDFQIQVTMNWGLNENTVSIESLVPEDKYSNLKFGARRYAVPWIGFTLQAKRLPIDPPQYPEILIPADS